MRADADRKHGQRKEFFAPRKGRSTARDGGRLSPRQIVVPLREQLGHLLADGRETADGPVEVRAANATRLAMSPRCGSIRVRIGGDDLTRLMHPHGRAKRGFGAKRRTTGEARRPQGPARGVA